MNIPQLDAKTKKELNALTDEEVSSEVSFAYEHEVLKYGIDAITHVHLMNMAKEITKGEISYEEFAKKYALNFKNQDYGFTVPLEKIEADGIFIPKQAYWHKNTKKADERIELFHGDYRNYVMGKSWVEKDYAYGLINRKWNPSDLTNQELIKQGIQFGQDMWKRCVNDFKICKEGEYNESRNPKNNYWVFPPQPQKVTNLAEKLIGYYSMIAKDE